MYNLSNEILAIWILSPLGILRKYGTSTGLYKCLCGELYSEVDVLWLLNDDNNDEIMKGCL